jgi:hypothetical protein
MFSKILIANRGDNSRSAAVAAKPNGLGREAHAGGFPAMESSHV